MRNHDLTVLTVICLMVIAVTLAYIAVTLVLDRLEIRSSFDEVADDQRENTEHLLLYLQQIHGYLLPVEKPSVHELNARLREYLHSDANTWDQANMRPWVTGFAAKHDPLQMVLPFNVIDSVDVYSD